MLYIYHWLVPIKSFGFKTIKLKYEKNKQFVCLDHIYINQPNNLSKKYRLKEKQNVEEIKFPLNFDD